MNFELERKRLIDNLVLTGYLNKPEVIKAMSTVPRHLFIPEDQKRHAYEDRPLPIGRGQTISAPHMVAIMTENLDVEKYNKILEIGSGSGYQAAVLAEIASEGFIHTVERIPELVEMSIKNLHKAGYKNVEVIVGDGTQGYQSRSPYDRIIVTAGSPKIPQMLIEQLGENSKMLIPVGGQIYQDLISVEKRNNEVIKKNLGGCMFVPLIGEDGW